MIAEAIATIHTRGGSSRKAIKEYILANYKVNKDVFDRSFRVALKHGVDNETFVQNKQSFRLSPSEARKHAPKKPKSKSTTRTTKKKEESSEEAAPKKKKSTRKTTTGAKKKTTTRSRSTTTKKKKDNPHALDEHEGQIKIAHQKAHRFRFEKENHNHSL